MKKVVLGITGGIAAVKIPELIDLLQKKKIDTVAIMTKGAASIIPQEEIEKKTKNIVYTDLFRNPIDTEYILKNRKVEHIELVKNADLFVIAPATANIIAKLALGIADDYMTTTVLAATCAIILCPSMNVHMWENPATQKNIEVLKARGYQVINPDTGLLACGYEGQGRLASPTVIVEVISSLLEKTNALKGKKVLITSGGTIEPIDNVRFIANRSSGKMGAALAESTFLSGANVIILRSKSSVKPRFNVAEELFETADDLEKLIEKQAKSADIIIHAAAVSDFKVDNTKIGKISSKKRITLDLKPREKILEKIKTYNPKTILVGFKAVWGGSEKELVEIAKEALKKSDADVIVANDLNGKDRGFESDTNEVWIVRRNGQVMHVPLASKTIVAQKILDEIYDL